MARSSIYPPSVTPGIPRLGDRPDGWIQVTYGDVLGKHIRKAEIQDEHKYQLVTAKRSRGGIVPRSQLYGKEIKTEAQFYISTNDFLISKRQIIHGACGIVPAYLDGAIVSGEYSVLRIKSGLLLDYLKYHYHTIYFQQSCFQSSVGVDVEKMIFDLDQWLKFKVYLPPICEQREIAKILSTWDEAIDLTAQLIAVKQRRKQALMQRLLTIQVRFPGFEDEWTRDKLQNIMTIEYGKSPNEIRDDNGSYKIFGTGGVVGKTNVALCNIPAVIIGRKGTIDKPILAKEPFWTIDTTFYCLPKRETNVEWLYYALSQIDLKQYNEASGVPSLSRNTLYDVELQVPPVAEQRKIADLLLSCDQELNLLQQKLAAFRCQKQGLMQQLLTGKIRVKV